MVLVDFSEPDLRVLRAMVHEYRNRHLGGPRRLSTEESWTENNDYQAPEVYIGIPQTNIPALTEAADTDAGDYDEPGRATCNVYEIVDEGTPELRPVSGFSPLVYNLGQDIASGDRTLLVRDKFGKWLTWLTCAEFRLFELKTDLQSGGVADAYRRFHNGTHDASDYDLPTFEVWDYIGDREGIGRDSLEDGSEEGPGAIGLAMQLPGETVWRVVDLECP